MKSLYHYCSIETLESILKYGTIRFSSLSIVDDMEEVLTKDFDDIGRICFVSCWTDADQEDVSMWRTYTETNTGSKSGVRIELPSNFFQDGEYERETLDKLEMDYDITISPSEDEMGVKYPTLFPVTYTKDDSLIQLPVHSSKEYFCDICGKRSLESNINTGFIGKFKRDIWSGQNEWRYRIIAIPSKYYRNNQLGKYNDTSFTLEEMIERMDTDLKTIPFKQKYIDYPVPKSFFEVINVVTSPLNTEDDNEKVQEILNDYCNGKTYKQSKLLIRKRNV